jgi:hypothetical protein
MEHIRLGAISGLPKQVPLDWAWLIALLILPFASYVSLGLLSLLLIIVLYRRGEAVAGFLWRQGFWLLTLGLGLSSSVGLYPGNAFLQMANFVPYFFLFGTLLTAPGTVNQLAKKLTILAQALVITSLPVSLMALLEYGCKFPAIATHVSDWPALSWVFDNDFGHRAHAMLSHPNILSNYLVIILGLSLGLLWHGTLPTAKRLTIQDRPFVQGLLYSATALSLVGIFCAGSRNGMIIAVCQLLVLGCVARRSRFLVGMGVGVAIAIVTSTIILGFGGRQFSLALFTQDPRIGVWSMAWDLIRQRPCWVGG